MANTWRFTGPAENWITAIGIQKWALNPNNKSLWEHRIAVGDTVVFHATGTSAFTSKVRPAIIGYATVGNPLHKKTAHWWMQEVRDTTNYWPYVVPLENICVFSDTAEIDFTTANQHKDATQIAREIECLTKQGIPLAQLTEQAKAIDEQIPKFPTLGSASGIRPIYATLITEHTSTCKEKSDLRKDR